MLTFNLKKEWFEKIKRGEKTHEYMVVKPYWNKRFLNIAEAITKEKYKRLYPAIKINGIERLEPIIRVYCCFKLGYPKENEKEKILFGWIKNISIINGKNTDLAIDADVYDIEFGLMSEVVTND